MSCRYRASKEGIKQLQSQSIDDENPQKLRKIQTLETAELFFGELIQPQLCSARISRKSQILTYLTHKFCSNVHLFYFYKRDANGPQRERHGS